MQLKEDLLFANRYTLQKLLGRGGFSEVWLGADGMTHLDVAVKVYSPGQSMDEDGLKDFCKELSNVYALNHTNLLKPQHVDSWEGMPYLIMAYCEQGSCYGRVGKFTEEEAWKLIGDVASGLAYLHAQDIIHQDIKPDNILIDNNGNYVITDFGISVQARSTLRKSAHQASTGGTTAYMAPERFSRDAAPVKASDIWSLGATVYELITGRMPFGEVGGGMQRGGAEIPTINAKISPVLRQTIIRMLAEDPWERPTASLLADWSQNPSAIPVGPDDPIDGGNSFLKVSPSKIDANPAGGEAKLFIKADKDWRCFCEQQKWCSAEKLDHESLVVKYKPNQTGEERKTVVNIVAGSRASMVTVSQASLPKKPALVFVIVSVLVVLGAFGVWKLWNNKDEVVIVDGIPPEVQYEKQCREFDFWNRRINEENTLTDTIRFTSALFELQGIERMEKNPDFKKKGINPVFSVKLKEYRDNLVKALAAVQDELMKKRATWKDNPNSKFDDNPYIQVLIKKEKMINRILELSEKGSVMTINIKEL